MAVRTAMGTSSGQTVVTAVAPAPAAVAWWEYGDGRMVTAAVTAAVNG